MIRKFKDKLNRLFGLALHIAMVDITLDVVGACLIENIATVAPWLNYLVNTVFYMVQVLFPAIMLLYVYILTGGVSKRVQVVIFAPASVFVAMLLLNPLTHGIFSIAEINGELAYIHGGEFLLMYFGSAAYIAFTAIRVLVSRRRLTKTQVHTIISFNAVIVAAMILQFFMPDLLLTGVAMSVAILMMFFAMQNPEAMLDVITGVFNYTALNHQLAILADEKKGICLTAVDVGGIRRINSIFGVSIGNALLRKIGDFLNKQCRGDATVFRMIGTRFLIISHDEASNRAIVEAITGRFTSPWEAGDIEVPLIATVRFTGEKSVFSSSEDVVNLIDIVYSRAAAEGFGTIRMIENELLGQARRKAQIEDAVRRALNNGEGFSLCFQPLYCVKNGGYHSAEVLLRLNDPLLGAIAPGDFIPVIESTGLIRQVDSLVLQLSCDFLRKHPKLDSTVLKRLEVNLSAAEFYNDSCVFADDIASKLEIYGERLCFEVTETAATTHREILLDFMESCNKRGVIFAIDDFGTGYANIAQLAQLPFSIVKLDRSLILSEKRKDRILLEDLLRMFNRIGLETVVEGVETPKQAKDAASFGVDYIQGYYYSVPLSEEEFVKFMNGNMAELA